MKTFHVGCKALIKDDRGVLLLTRKTDDGIFYDIPGGRIDGDEDFAETLAREVSEELPGATLESVGRLVKAKRIHKDIMPDISLILLFFEVKVTLPEEIAFSHEHDGYIFIKSKSNIPTDIGEEYRELVEDLIGD